ncbi:hypothetical protein [Saccharopolyspora sp. NPDC002686]|uniref:hypothetical protein n=1 Tax=Saccharopolyspora sp. NPDC002686 TaxID=3154541 RepID=UPI00331856B3
MTASAEAQWQLVNGMVHMRVAVPEKEPVTVQGPTVCGCLMGVRDKLPRVVFMAQGARRDAWWGTPEHPCAVDEVLIYPAFGQPPLPTRQPALGFLPEKDLGFLATSSAEQMMYRAEWEDDIPPSVPRWSVRYAHRRNPV